MNESNSGLTVKCPNPACGRELPSDGAATRCACGATLLSDEADAAFVAAERMSRRDPRQVAPAPNIEVFDADDRQQGPV